MQFHVKTCNRTEETFDRPLPKYVIKVNITVNKTQRNKVPEKGKKCSSICTD